LWFLVIDKLLTDIEQQLFEVIGFADDLVIIVRRKVDLVLNEQLQIDLNYATEWCKGPNLSINTKNPIVNPLTRKRNLNLVEPMMGKFTVEFSNKT
jgi:hypothetical protein